MSEKHIIDRDDWRTKDTELEWWVKLSETERLVFKIASFFVTLSILGYLLTNQFPTLDTLTKDFSSNFITEAIFLIITIFILERLNKHLTIEERKKTLIGQLRSPSNDFALEAVRLLRDEGWLEDGTISGKPSKPLNLRDANLQGANLSNAKMNHVDLRGANLQNVKFESAQLINSNLKYADLRNANLSNCDLRRANLSFSDLENTSLYGTRFEGCNLSIANLQGSSLVFMQRFLDNTDSIYEDLVTHADFNQETYLPDGTKWTTELTTQDLAWFCSEDKFFEWLEDKKNHILFLRNISLDYNDNYWYPRKRRKKNLSISKDKNSSEINNSYIEKLESLVTELTKIIEEQRTGK